MECFSPQMPILPLLALPPHFEITRFSKQEGTLCVSLLSTQPSSHCPLCGSAATRIHSRYQRTLADLPSVGQSVCFLLWVRKFFCDTPTCPRKIFAERLTPFVAPRARVTARLFQVDETHWLGHWREAWCACDGSNLSRKYLGLPDVLQRWRSFSRHIGRNVWLAMSKSSRSTSSA
jgi:zinc-finger of transposase IS204/IS1001/IS1096/IS1165